MFKHLRYTLLAITHNDPKVSSTYTGDWKQWWAKNQKFIQSGGP